MCITQYAPFNPYKVSKKFWRFMRYRIDIDGPSETYDRIKPWNNHNCLQKKKQRLKIGWTLSKKLKILMSIP